MNEIDMDFDFRQDSKCGDPDIGSKIIGLSDLLCQ